MFVTHNDVILSFCYQSQLSAFTRYADNPDVKDVSCATIHNSDPFTDVAT
jgi:hypothetical protein